MSLRRALSSVLAAAMLLAGCERAPPAPAQEPVTPAPSARPVAPPPAAKPAAAPAVLTPDGLGPLKIGMTLAEVVAAGGIDNVGEGPSEPCEQFELLGHRDAWAMFDDGRLSRISVHGASSLRTEDNLGVGATVTQVKAAHGPALQVEAHAYDGPEALYLTAWTVNGKRGLRYETNPSGVVEIIHAGDETIQRIEGCS